MDAEPTADPGSTRIPVDFYVLDADGQAAGRFACRLAEKAWLTGHRVHLHAGCEAEAREVDDLLWTFRQDSFVPHALADPAEQGSPVTIGWDEAPAGAPDVLINLSQTVPSCAGRCSRIAEIVGAGDPARRAGRQRYRIYRDGGFLVRSHEMSIE